MPRDVRMPDGTLIRNVPDDVSREELLKKFQASQARAPSIPESQIGRQRLEGPAREAAEARLTPARETESPFLVGVGRGLERTAEGLQQLLALAQQDPQRAQEIFQRSQSRQELLEPLQRVAPQTAAGQFVGEAAPGLAIPGGVTGGIGRRLATGALAGAAQGAIDPAEDIQQRGINSLLGLSGGATGVGIQSGTARFFRGGESAVELAREAQRLGFDPARVPFRSADVPLSVGELRGNLLLQTFERILDNVPIFGTNRFRQTQRASLENAAERLRGQFPQASGEDLTNALRRGLEKAEKKVNVAFRKVDVAAAKSNEVVTQFNRMQVAQDLLQKELAKGPDADQAIVKLLREQTDLEPVSFKTATEIRSQLLENVRAADRRTTSGVATRREVAIRSQLEEALERDLEDFAERAGGDTLRLFREANQQFVDTVLPFRKGELAKVIEPGFDTDQVIGKFIKAGRQNLAEKLVQGLDKEGKTAAKFLVLDKAFEDAVRNDIFQPQIFARRLESLRKANDVIFSPQEAAQLKGFVRLSAAASRAGRAPSQLFQVGFAGLGIGAAVQDPEAALKGGGSIFALTLLLTSNTGRRILTQAGRAGDRSKVMERLIQDGFAEVGRLIRSSSVRAGSEAAQTQTERVIQ